MTRNQLEKIIEILTFLSLGGVSGGIADWVVRGTMPVVDLVGIVSGLTGLVATVVLTGKLGGDKL